MGTRYVGVCYISLLLNINVYPCDKVLWNQKRIAAEVTWKFLIISFVCKSFLRNFLHSVMTIFSREGLNVTLGFTN